MKAILWIAGGLTVATVGSGSGSTAPPDGGMPGIVKPPEMVIVDQGPVRVRPPTEQLLRRIEEAIREAELASRQIEMEQMLREIDLQQIEQQIRQLDLEQLREDALHTTELVLQDAGLLNELEELYLQEPPRPPFPPLPDLDSIYPDLDSIYPDLDSIYLDLDSIYPDLDSIYPDLDSIYPDLDSMYPDLESIYPDLELMYPDLEMMLQEPPEIEFEFPEFEFPQFELPEFQFPELEFTDFELGQLYPPEPPMPPLPAIDFSDFDIDFSDFDIGFGRSGRGGLLELLEMTYQQPQDPGLALFNEAKALLFDEKFQEAREKFLEMAQAFARSAYVDDAYFWAAYAQEHMRNQYEAAFQAYQEFLNNYAESPFVTHAKARMAQLAGRLYQQGMEQYKRYLDEWKEDPEEDIRLYALQALVQQEDADVVGIVEQILADGSASVRLKRAAVDLLRREDDPRAVQVLEGTAREHADPEVRRRAIQTLGNKADKAGYDALVRLYRDEQSVNARRYIVEAIGPMRRTDHAAEAANFLAGVVESDENEDVRSRALSVLRAFDSTVSMPHLTNLLDKIADPGTRRTVLSSIARNEDTERIPILMREIRSGTDERTRRAAVSYLSSIEGPEALDALISIARSEITEVVRVEAVDEIGGFEGSKAADALVEIARSNAPTRVRIEALDELGNRQIPTAFAVMRDLATSGGEESLREKALSEIRNWGAEAIPVLEQIALNDTERDMRSRAVSALGRLEDGAGFDSLVKVYKSSTDTRIRSGVIDYLWRINEERSLDTVIQAAKSDSDPEVRRHAVQLLGRSENARAKQALRELLNIPPVEGK